MAPSIVSDSGRVLLLLCSSVALPRGETARPLGPKGWARVSARLAGGGLEPSALVGMEPAALAAVAKDAAEAESMARLLARSGQLAFELDRLATRGIGVVTLADETYPSRLRERLGGDAPPVLYVAGDASILDEGGVAIVGSRDVTEDAAEFARAVATAVAGDGRVIVSGGARGVDAIAIAAGVEAGGRVAAVLPEGIERRVRESSTRAVLADGRAVVASPYNPAAGFTAGAAMARNKLIYALADVAVVVASAAESGGTWAGAIEAIDARWVPVFVRQADGVPAGNRLLLERGAIPLSDASAPVVPADWKATPHPEPSRPRGRRGLAEKTAGVEQPTLDLVD